MLDELKPCPFCGSNVEIKESSNYVGSPSTASGGGFSSGHYETTYSIMCGNKDGCWLTMARHYHCREKMIKEWNTRSDVLINV